jgi:hypothetical protein
MDCRNDGPLKGAVRSRGGKIGIEFLAGITQSPPSFSPVPPMTDVLSPKHVESNVGTVTIGCRESFSRHSQLWLFDISGQLPKVNEFESSRLWH